ncbi:hypothetical protein DE146DRAFT_524889 [Phaeosphaeria sp. MPI-PUGE-AT-0046c]|nr:hypothetical protein DE146DRAFT_524889 [Phaeosphaeria sp. MPI-PUGE-AT-0046c]
MALVLSIFFSQYTTLTLPPLDLLRRNKILHMLSASDISTNPKSRQEFGRFLSLRQSKVTQYKVFAQASLAPSAQNVISRVSDMLEVFVYPIPISAHPNRLQPHPDSNFACAEETNMGIRWNKGNKVRRERRQS